MTYDELQAKAHAEFDAARAGFRPRPGGYPGRHEHWVEVMAQSVCQGVGKFPSNLEPESVPLSKTFVAQLIVGGGFIFEVGDCPSLQAFRVSSGVLALSPFVMVQLEFETVAMTVDEAFRRGLREVEFPDYNPNKG